MDYTEKKQEIDKDVKSNDIILYMKGDRTEPRCGYSAHTVQILTESGVEFADRDVLQDDILREAIKEYSDWPTIPQLYIKGEFIGGADIVNELFESGELVKLLKA